MTTAQPVFSTDIPADAEHARMIREEAFEWLERHYPGAGSFRNGPLLRIANEGGQNWLVARIHKAGIGESSGLAPRAFDLPGAADALTVLFLRKNGGVKFREAVDSVLRDDAGKGAAGPRYAGLWNRLIDIARKRIDRRMKGRLLGAAVFALLRNPQDHPNCLVVIRRGGQSQHRPGKAREARHDYVHRAVSERPAPTCWVLSPFREVMFLDGDQLPTRSEITSRHFSTLLVQTERETYELMLGTMSPAAVTDDDKTLRLAGRILDVIHLDLQRFLDAQAGSRFDTPVVPGLSDADDLQLWLITRMISGVYPGSLCEVIEVSASEPAARVLASSATDPWDPSLWDPPKTLEMLSGYSGRTGIPLVVEKVEHPWASLIESIGSEVQYLRNHAANGSTTGEYSAVALPVNLTNSESSGALYLLAPKMDPSRLEIEIRVLTIFGRIVGEIIERQRAAIFSADVSADVAGYSLLGPEPFKDALLGLLHSKAQQLGDARRQPNDLRLPFLLLSAHSSESNAFVEADARQLKVWLVQTLKYLDWRSFMRTRWAAAAGSNEAFIGELPGAGVIIALGQLVTKDELDRIRNVLPTTINRINPANSPVRLVSWVLDVPAHRIGRACEEDSLDALADEVEKWAFDVSTVVEEVVTSNLAKDSGDWDAVLRTVRRGLLKDGGSRNGFLYRLAADAAFSLGDWPSALKYARKGVELSHHEPGGGEVRAMCQQADAHLCIGEPLQAWDVYSAAARLAPTHPRPLYHRGQAMLLLGRLVLSYEDERLRSAPLAPGEASMFDAARNSIVDRAMDDLTSAVDLLAQWGLIPESYQYRNYQLVPSLLGQGTGYLLARSPGPAAARLQSARRSFPKDDLLLHEYLFAKCLEQGVHRRYGELLLGETWPQLEQRLHH